MPTPERDEIAEKAAWWTSATVDARLREVFSADDVYAASIALAALAPDPDCPPEALMRIRMSTHACGHQGERGRLGHAGAVGRGRAV